MEYRIFDTIINVDKPLNAKQVCFVEMIANFIELVLGSDEAFMSLAMIKMGAMAELLAVGLNKQKEPENLEEDGNTQS